MPLTDTGRTDTGRTDTGATAGNDAAIAKFLAHLEHERRASPRTIAAYRDDLAQYSAFLASAPGGTELVRAGPELVRGFVAQQHRDGLAATSIQRRLSACRSLYRYLLREGLARSNPADAIRAPKAPRKLPNVLDADEAGALLELPGDAPLAARDRAMLELFYSSALRLSELCALRWGDLDLDAGLVRLKGKGDKTRIVPVGRKAIEALRALGSGPGGYVFAGRNGPISPRAVQKRLKLLAQRQGLWKRVHPHLMRHSCASHMLESSGNLRAVQEMLGHADIATTQIYTHLDFQHLAKVYDAAHPRAKRRKPA
ncbi:MAG TPA: tyrosine recombinase XerC [Candidatus Saccharimonadia bacterium]|nr:tyrosine recombinase XerC [Candidatus Saccharimonadia bacterium]